MNRLAKRLERIARMLIAKDNDDFFDYFEWVKRSIEHDSGITVGWDENDKHQVIQMVFHYNYGWDDDVLDGKKSKLFDSGVMEWIKQFRGKDGQVDEDGLKWKFWEPRIVDHKWDGEVVVLTVTKDLPKSE